MSLGLQNPHYSDLYTALDLGKLKKSMIRKLELSLVDTLVTQASKTGVYDGFSLSESKGPDQPLKTFSMRL